MKWWQFIKRRERIYGLNTFRLSALLVLIVFMLLSVLLGINASRQNHRDSKAAFDNRVATIETAIRTRLELYEEILRGSAGLFNAANVVTLAEWQRFARQFNIAERHPGMLSLAFARYIPATDADAFITQQRGEGNGEFAITSDGSRNEMVLVTYSEPLPTQNRKFLGYDLLSLPGRREALYKARDTGQPVLSDTFVALSSVGQTQSPNAFSVYMPIYRNHMPTDTVEQRQAAIYGFVYSTFNTTKLLESIVSEYKNDFFAIQITDDAAGDNAPVVYQTDNYHIIKDTAPLMHLSKFIIENHTWDARFVSTYAPFVESTARQRPLNVVLYGSLFSILLSGFLYMLMVSRARRITQSKQLEVQKAKDELLSLASHQLRTPATGVKQYIGMVLQGYTGDITPQQRTMLQKAYQSNERQLETINQILYVTKADAGRIKLSKQKVDINTVIKDIIAEQADTFRDRRQTIRYRPKRRRVLIQADEQYMRMAIENLISNAGKYSHDGAVITVRCEKRDNKICISVKDNGVGIGPGDIPKLFNKFSRIDNELSVKAGGSGIGLYLTRQIVELHGGSITVVSRPGQGSTFTITLPVRSRIIKRKK